MQIEIKLKHVGKQPATMMAIKRLAGVAQELDIKECTLLTLPKQKRIRQNPVWF